MSSILQMNKVRQGEFNELALVPWSCVCVCGGGEGRAACGYEGVRAALFAARPLSTKGAT